MPRSNDPGRSVGSRLLDVLFAFEPGRTSMSIADLVEATSMPRATVRRHVLELVEVGALSRDGNGHYVIGLRLWRLGTLAPFTEPLRAVAKPFMEDLSVALRQHVQLAVLDGQEAAIIERLSAPKAVDLVSQVGGRLPLHCTGVGKILLSHAPADFIDEILARPLTMHTPATVTDPVRLRQELAASRSHGTAVVRGELSPDASSYATRIMNGSGHVVAALSVVVREGSVREHAVLPAVVTSGLNISRLLGWRPGLKPSR